MSDGSFQRTSQSLLISQNNSPVFVFWYWVSLIQRCKTYFQMLCKAVEADNKKHLSVHPVCSRTTTTRRFWLQTRIARASWADARDVTLKPWRGACDVYFCLWGKNERVWRVDGVKEGKTLVFSMLCECCGIFPQKPLVLPNEMVSSTCQIEASKCLCCREDTTQRRQQSHDVIATCHDSLLLAILGRRPELLWSVP